MERFGRIILLTLGLGLFAVALSFFPRHPVAAATDPPAIPVNVENTPTVKIIPTPLPVTGSVDSTVSGAVSIIGTPSVQITNAPAVNVNNTPTSAIPTVVAPAASTIYDQSCSAPITGDPQGCTFAAFSPNTLIVTSFSISVGGTNEAPGSAGLGLTSASGFTPVVLAPMSLQLNPGYWVGAVTGFFPIASSLSPPSCSVYFPVVASFGTVTCTVTGYLIPPD